MRWWVPYLFVAPNMLGLLIFTLVPMVGGLLISLTNWNVVSGLSNVRWVGLSNFRTLVVDPSFWLATLRTIGYAGCSVPLTMILGLALALALNRPLPGRAALRLIFFSPTVVNIIAIGTVWLSLLNPDSGVINQGLRAVGLSNPPGWLISTHWALPALVLISIWGGAGYQCIIYLAALQDMPEELFEAAKIDGAGAWRRFLTVTWPALMPTTIFLAVTGFIGHSQSFGLIAFLTGGGPGDSTTVLSYYMYQNGFQYYRFGYASAIGVMSFLGVRILTLVLWRVQRGRGLYT